MKSCAEPGNTMGWQTSYMPASLAG